MPLLLARHHADVGKKPRKAEQLDVESQAHSDVSRAAARASGSLVDSVDLGQEFGMDMRAA